MRISANLEERPKSAEADELSFLYPPIEASAQGHLKVDGGHEVWWETSGDNAGVPVIYLHGGPGAPPKATHRRFFDPDFYRLVVMHQRGCGRSIPLASTEWNSTDAIIRDIEALRVHLGIERWLVVGGSWGSCLALAYGQRHPDRCLGFRLRGVCLGRRSEMEWWWNGTRMLFPEAFDELLDFLPQEERSNPEQSYYNRLMDIDPTIHLPAARAFSKFSASTVHLTENHQKISASWDADVALPLARLFIYFSTNGFFLRPNQLLEDLPRIEHLPCLIVSGRYDVTTPVDSAWTLHKAWPGSKFTALVDGAHDELDPGVARAILDSHEELKAQMK